MNSTTYRPKTGFSLWRAMVAILMTASLAGGLVVATDMPAEANSKSKSSSSSKNKGGSTTTKPVAPPATPKPCGLTCTGGTVSAGGTPTTGGKTPTTTPTVAPTPTLNLAPGSADCKKPQYANDARCYDLRPGSTDCKKSQWRENPRCWYDLTPTPQSSTGIAFFNMETPVVYYSAGKGGGWRSNPSPLPPLSLGGFNATVDKYTGRTVYVPKTNNAYVIASDGTTFPQFGYYRGNGYTSWCMTTSKNMVDPDGDAGVARRYKPYFAIGVRWTDTLSFNNAGIPQRNITYTCIWPAEPQARTMTCPVWGDGLITGALANSKGLPLMVNGSPLTVSTPREWNPQKKYTPLGQRLLGVNATGTKTGRSNPYLGFNPNTQDESYVNYLRANCKDFNYLEQINLEKCKQASTGNLLSPADCAVIPGNYNNNFKGQQALCEFTYYPLLFMGRDAYEAEGCNEMKAPINKTVPITVYCDNTEVIGKHDLSYNFGTCNQPPKTAAMCTWSNGSGNPSITDPAGKSIINGSQILADGEKYKATWPVPTVAGARDAWQQWVLLSSGGMNPNLAPDDPKQSFFGHYDKGVSANGASGFIVNEGSKKGLPGWTKRDFFMSFFDGVKANATDVVPFTMEPQFHWYTTKTVRLELNGNTPITYDVMETCRGKSVTLYPLSGRVTQ